MQMTEKDSEQDRMIKSNSVRIERSEAAIRRQTEMLEQIRDHYYPPPKSWWRRMCTFCGKVVCVILAYLGVAEAVDWLWNTRESQGLAERYASVAEQLFYGEGDTKGAVACYEKAIKLNPKESEYLMAITFMKGAGLISSFMDNDRLPTDAEQAKVDAALGEAMVMSRVDPKDPMPHVLMAQAYLLSGEQTEALASVEQAIALAHDRAAVHVSACAIYFGAGKTDRARAELSEAERLNPSMPLVCVWKGLLALRADRDAEAALKHFEAATRILPRYSLAHMMIGRAILESRNPDLKRAREAFGRALVLNAGLTSAMNGMAETFERENNLVMARLWLDRSLVVAPDYMPSLMLRARISIRQGDYASAVADLSSAVALAPYRVDIYRLRAEAHDGAGDKALAKKDRDIAAELSKQPALIVQ